MRSIVDVVLEQTKAGGIALAAAAALTLAGCGGGDSVVAGGGTVTGTFIDATVVGLGYKCGTSAALSGSTNASGEFTCKTGEAVAFYVGGIKLGSVAAAQAVVTPLDLVGAGAGPSNPKVINIVRFLMSISSTPAASGTLTINPAVMTAATALAIDFTQDTPTNLDTVITAVKPAGAVVATQQEATDHMASSIKGLFAGSFSGTFGGSLGGTWVLTIDKQGVVTGTATDTTQATYSVVGSMATTVGTGSTYSFTGTSGGVPWTGTLNLLTKQFSGTWNDGAGASGTFTGKAAAPAQPPANSGGSGGAVTLTYATYSAPPFSGGTQTGFTLKSMTVEDAGFAAPNPKANRVTLLGSGGGFEREIKIYVRDSDCVIINIAHAWAGTVAGLSGQGAISSFVSDPTIGNALGLEPANNTVTFNDTLLNGNVPHVSTLKGTVKPSTKMCASAVVS